MVEREEPIILNRIAEILAELKRGGLSITQAELADIVGVTPQTMSKYATNKMTMYDTVVIAKICIVLGVTIDRLLVLSNPMKWGHEKESSSNGIDSPLYRTLAIPA